MAGTGSALLRTRRMLASVLTVGVLGAGAVIAAPAASAHHPSHRHTLGSTTVTTAPGIATTLLRAGILPLPARHTGFGVSVRHGLQVSYRFPITANSADLAAGTGDILHAGGIRFVSRSASLEIGSFDIDLAAGTVFATQVNGAAARIAVLDLDLSGLTVTTRHHRTTLSGIVVRLDPAAAGALDATFGIALPTDGSLVFGSAKVVIAG